MTLCTYKYNYIFHDSLNLNHKGLIFFCFNVIFDFLLSLLYLSTLQCSSHNSIYFADFRWSVNHVTSWYHRAYKICVFNFDFLGGGGRGRFQPGSFPVGVRPKKCPSWLRVFNKYPPIKNEKFLWLITLMKYVCVCVCACVYIYIYTYVIV